MAMRPSRTSCNCTVPDAVRVVPGTADGSDACAVASGGPGCDKTVSRSGTPSPSALTVASVGVWVWIAADAPQVVEAGVTVDVAATVAVAAATDVDGVDVFS